MATLLVEQELSLDPVGPISGLVDLLIVEFGARSVLYALSRSDNRLVELEIANDGTLSIVNSLALTGTFASGSDPGLSHIALANGVSALALAGLPETNGQMVSLSNDGTLGEQSGLAGVGTMASPATIALSGVSLMISGANDVGLNLFTDTGAGFGWTAALTDTSDRYLGDVSALVTFTIGQQTFVGTASALENGINLARVTNAGLTQAGALGPGEFLPIGTPEDIEVVQRLGETHLVVAASGSSSLTTIAISPGGEPLFSDHVLDSQTTAISGARAVETILHGDTVYIATGGDEGGMSLFTMLPGGRLVHLDTIADSNTLSLERIASIEVAISGSALQIFGGSFWSDKITQLGYDLTTQGAVVIADDLGNGAVGASLNDQVIGSDVAEALLGGAGDDILLDGAGIDTLTGGSGEDLFALAADGVLDIITDFERGIDKLDLSAFDFLYDVSQISLTPEVDGATLTHATETLRLFTSDSAPLTIAELTNEDILNVDRPPFLAIAQQLIGGPSADTLNGGLGGDTLRGGGSDDVLFGNGGNDLIEGGTGNDQIDGGAGADTLRGQEHADTIVGSTGNDLIFGDGGDDVIYGDAFDW